MGIQFRGLGLPLPSATINDTRYSAKRGVQRRSSLSRTVHISRIFLRKLGLSKAHPGERDHDGYVVLDPKLMDKLRLKRGISRRGFAELADTSPTTAYRFFNGRRIQTRIARQLFSALDFCDMTPYLIRTGDGQELDATVLAEWQIENALTQSVQLSNGLAFQYETIPFR